jgi:2-polyprenyl-6-methoxyphenol hydroxylase-like FAD-dependent oxidoreductase
MSSVIHRQDCHDILLEEAKRLGATIVLDACVQDICLASNKAILADGTEKEADVIVGADGKHHSVHNLFPTPLLIIFLYRTMVHYSRYPSRTGSTSP